MPVIFKCLLLGTLKAPLNATAFQETRKLIRMTAWMDERMVKTNCECRRHVVYLLCSLIWMWTVCLRYSSSWLLAWVLMLLGNKWVTHCQITNNSAVALSVRLRFFNCTSLGIYSGSEKVLGNLHHTYKYISVYKYDQNKWHLQTIMSFFCDDFLPACVTVIV